MRLFTLEDIRDVYIKVYQRGFHFLGSKLSFNSAQKTKTTFNDRTLEVAYFWIIPSVKKRWNFLITGDSQQSYEEYLTHHFFKGKDQLKMLSLGSGVCSHEIKLAQLNENLEIHCFDFSDQLLQKAQQVSNELGLKNIYFYPENILTYPFQENEYDLVFFHASLHHFKNLNHFFQSIVLKSLRSKGHLIINEYVGKNRMQYSKEQIFYINKALKIIPPEYRKIFKTPLTKNKYFGSGWLRMYGADPSECVASQDILPTIYKYFLPIEEKPFGNNLLQSVFKDIAHHFVETNSKKEALLETVFALEDEYLKKYPSDFIFGIYQKKD